MTADESRAEDPCSTETSRQPTNPVLSVGSNPGDDLPAQRIVTGRGLISGVSGSGKSNSATVIAEEVLDLGIPLVVLDPEGEFAPLRDEYPAVVFGKMEDADASGDASDAANLARRAVAESLPVIFDLVECSEEEAEEIAAAVSDALFAAECRHETPMLFIVDELDEYLPEKGKTDASKPLTRVAQRGRKRGLGILGVSQRPADVSKDFVTQADYHLWHRLTWQNDVDVADRHLCSDFVSVLGELEAGEVILDAGWTPHPRQFYFRTKRIEDIGATPSIHESLGSIPSEIPSDLDTAEDIEEPTRDSSDADEGEKPDVVDIDELIGYGQRVSSDTAGETAENVRLPNVASYIGIEDEERFGIRTTQGRAVICHPDDDPEYTYEIQNGDCVIGSEGLELLGATNRYFVTAEPLKGKDDLVEIRLARPAESNPVP